MNAVIALIFIFLNQPTYARTFDLTEQTVGTYFKGNIGTSTVGKGAYGFSSGANSNFTNSVLYNWGGEIGLLLTSKKFGVRLGYEFINPIQQSGIEAKDTSGTIVAVLTSSVIGSFPVAHGLFYLSPNKDSRFIFSAGAGFGTIALSNTYHSFAGYPKSPYTAVGSAITWLAEVGTGFEYSFVDNVTMTLDLGYRFTPTTTFKADSTFQDVYGRTIAKGADVLNGDGTPVNLNLNGYWIGIGFTFYIHL